MEFERVPGRKAPGVPPPTSAARSLPSAEPSSSIAPSIRHDACTRTDSASARDHALVNFYKDPAAASEERLRQRWATLVQREDQLSAAEQSFAQSVAEWETQRRLWEANFTERLIALEAREAKLGSASHV
ncbi:hypothetical protein ABL78_3235 [Leptomonas seymouri]|uniref:Uncharacterized protein n=1 Tax=Leptomonas seymouri TaxID=5684 RepID=A0A0N0P6X9_LEPSE|nr:hypothetical protein ABL78_3235 [Leptomonas seymouri]|eukprot:KPI87697.1 hypothetical protein ABL78_3235 [Leptomonas seymouri]